MASELKRIDKQVFELPDGTIAYSFERAVEEFKRLKSNDYSVSDLVLFVLNSQKNYSVRGRTNLFKEIFVVEQELFSKYLFSWENVPGSESNTLVEYLQSNGLLSHGSHRPSKSEDGMVIHVGDLELALNDDHTRVVVRKEVGVPLHVLFVQEELDSFKVHCKTKNIEDCQFVPYVFGPYSFHVANTVKNLEAGGLIGRKGEKNLKNEEFQISKKGIQLIKEKYEDLDPSVRKGLETLRKGLEQYGTHWILNHVYNYYPQYRAKSKVAYKYKFITWGKGKG